MFKPYLCQKGAFLFLLMSINLLAIGQAISGSEMKIKDNTNIKLKSFSVIPSLEDSAIIASYTFSFNHEPYPKTIRASGWLFSGSSLTAADLSTEYLKIKKTWRYSLSSSTLFRHSSADYEKREQYASYIKLALSKQIRKFQITGSVAGNFLYNKPGKNYLYPALAYSFSYMLPNLARQLIVYHNLSAYVNTRVTTESDIINIKRTLLGTNITGIMYATGLNKFIDPLSMCMKIKTAILIGEYKYGVNAPIYKKLKAMVGNVQLCFQSSFKGVFNFNTGLFLSYLKGNYIQLPFHQITTNNFLNIYLKFSGRRTSLPVLAISGCSLDRLYSVKISLKF